MRVRATGLMQRIDAVLYKAVGLGASLVYSCQAHRRPSLHQRRRFRVVCLGLALASVVSLWRFWSHVVPRSMLPELAGIEECVYSEHDAGFGVLGDRRESSNRSSYTHSWRARDGSAKRSSGRPQGSGSKPSLAAGKQVTIVTFHAGWREVRQSRWSLGSILDSALGRCSENAETGSSDSSGISGTDPSTSSVIDGKDSESSGRGDCSRLERVPKPPGYHNWRGALHAMGYHPAHVVVLGDAFVWKLGDEAANWRGRVNAYRTYAQQHAQRHGPRALLVFTDAYDALALRGPAALVASWHSAQHLSAAASIHRRAHGSSLLHSSHHMGKGRHPNTDVEAARVPRAPATAGSAAAELTLPRVLFGAERLCDTLSCRADPTARARMASMQTSRGGRRGHHRHNYHYPRMLHRYNETATSRGSEKVNSGSGSEANFRGSEAVAREIKTTIKVRKSPRHYLNAGFFMGEASAVVGVLSHAFNYMATHPSADDQAAFVDFWLYHNSHAAAAVATADSAANSAASRLAATSEKTGAHLRGNDPSSDAPVNNEVGAVMALDYWGLLVATLSPSAQHNARDWTFDTAQVTSSGSDAPLMESVRPIPSLPLADQRTSRGTIYEDNGSSRKRRRSGSSSDDVDSGGVGGAMVSPVMVHFASLKPRAPPPFTSASSPALVATWLAALKPYDDDDMSASSSSSAGSGTTADTSSKGRALATKTASGPAVGAATGSSAPYSACEEHLAQVYNLLGRALQQRAAAALQQRKLMEAAAITSPLQSQAKVQPPPMQGSVTAPASEPSIGACSGGSIGGISSGGGGSFKFIPLRGVLGTKLLRRSSPATSTSTSSTGGSSTATVPSFTSPCNRWAPEPALRALKPGNFLAAGGYLVARGPFKSPEDSYGSSARQEGTNLRGRGSRSADPGLFDITTGDDGLDDDDINDVGDEDNYNSTEGGGADGGRNGARSGTSNGGSGDGSSGTAGSCRWVPLWYQPMDVPPRHLWPSPHHLLLAKLSKPNLKNNGALALEVTISRPLNAGQFDTWRTLWRSRISRSRQRLSSSSSSSTGLSSQAHLGIDAISGSLALVEGAPPPPWTTGAGDDDDDGYSDESTSGGASRASGTAAALWSAELRTNPARLIWATPAPRRTVHSASTTSRPISGSSSSSSRSSGSGSSRGSSGRRLNALLTSDSIDLSRIELVLWAEGALELRVRCCPYSTNSTSVAGSNVDDVRSSSLAAATSELSYVGDQEDRPGLTFVDGFALLGCVALGASLAFRVTRRWTSVAERRREGLRRRQRQEKHLGIASVPTSASMSNTVKGLDKDADAFAAYVERTADYYDGELYGRML